MSGNRQLNARRAVFTLVWNVATQGQFKPPGTSWQQILASVPAGVSAIEVYNGTGSVLSTSIGAPGSESAGLLPYTILPGGTTQVIPFDAGSTVKTPGVVSNGFRKGLPITVATADGTTTTTGIFVINAFA